MKKLLYKFLVIVVGVFIVDFSFGKIGDYLQTHAKGGMTKRTNDIAMKDDHDIVILGSSRAFRHYDTPYMSDLSGLDVYNAGYDGNGVVLAYGLMELIINRYCPKAIIYDVAPIFDLYKNSIDNNNVRYISCLKPYYRQESIGKLIKQISVREWYGTHSGLFRYNSSILTMVLDYLSEQNTYKSGFDPVFGQYEEDEKTNGQNNGKEREQLELDSLKISCINKIALLATSNKIPLVIVASPIYVANNEELKPVIEICKNNGAPFLNYYADSSFVHHKELFKDVNHLNADGARTFTKKIMQDLKDLNIICK